MTLFDAQMLVDHRAQIYTKLGIYFWTDSRPPNGGYEADGTANVPETHVERSGLPPCRIGGQVHEVCLAAGIHADETYYFYRPTVLYYEVQNEKLIAQTAKRQGLSFSEATGGQLTAQQRSNSSCRGKRRRNLVWFSSLLVAVRPTRRLAGDVGRFFIFHTWQRVQIMPSFKSGGRRPRKATGASELAGSWGGWLLREKLP